MISCFLERTRKKVRSLPGSKSRTTLRALSDNWLIRPAYCTVVELSKVLFTGIPVKAGKKICWRWMTGALWIKNKNFGLASNEKKMFLLVFDRYWLEGRRQNDVTSIFVYIDQTKWEQIMKWLECARFFCTNLRYSQRWFRLHPCAMLFSSMFLQPLVTTDDQCKQKKNREKEGHKIVGLFGSGIITQAQNLV